MGRTNRKNLCTSFLILTILYVTRSGGVAAQKPSTLIELGIQQRARSVLIKAGIGNVDQLTLLSEAEVRRIPGLGEAFVKHVMEQLSEHQLLLGRLDLPIEERSTGSIGLPMRLAMMLLDRGVKKVGQLVMLTESNLTGWLRLDDIRCIQAVIAKNGLSLKQECGNYDLPLGLLLPETLEITFWETGVRTLKELSLLSEKECEILVPASDRAQSMRLLRETLNLRGLQFDSSPFPSLGFSQRIALYRDGISTEEQLSSLSSELNQALIDTLRTQTKPTAATCETLYRETKRDSVK